MSRKSNNRCNTCEYNNHGWCNKYKLQKPKAIIECDKEQEEANILEQIIEDSEEAEVEYKNNNTDMNFTNEEIEIIIHALEFTSKMYYDEIINTLENDIIVHTKDIDNIYTGLLDQNIKEQEILNDLLEEFEKLKLIKGDVL